MAAIIEAVRDWIASCPLVEENAILGVDHLVADPIGYTVDTVPCNPVASQYVDGSQLRQFPFVFASRNQYADTAQNLANSAFYDNFSDWIAVQNKLRQLPELGKYRTAQRVEITTSGYVYDTGDSTARYQIQLKLTYYQDRRYNNG
ncbi:chloramphenicol resistance protein [uncultured Ruminococcus sp.]|uniref:chloramphenicol resistance protein n=1 Tax=uncultured Ruminococcus sp. TaxID=165186 RepID=UPI0026737E9E|nr:chloramphenicol resistance protein [uncultured Ruminococcus sp.]